LAARVDEAGWSRSQPDNDLGWKRDHSEMRSNPAIHFPQLLEKEEGTTTNGHEYTRLKEKNSDCRLMKTNADKLAVNRCR
jgi:hypothetical protein